jgi:hypothetical protein
VGDRTRYLARDTAQDAGAGPFFSAFLSFLMGTATAQRAEFRLETRPNSSESSVEVLCDFRGKGVAREREDRLVTRGTG